MQAPSSSSSAHNHHCSKLLDVFSCSYSLYFLSAPSGVGGKRGKSKHGCVFLIQMMSSTLYHEKHMGREQKRAGERVMQARLSMVASRLCAFGKCRV